MSRLVDTHAHLNDPQFERDLDQVLDRAREAGVSVIITVGYDLESSERAAELATLHEKVFATVGIHPNHSVETSETDWARIEELERREKVVAIGETGLDFYREFAPLSAQRAAFERQLRLAEDIGLPLIVHSRGASQECLELISALGVPHLGAVMHCFEGTPDQAARALEMGMFISANGMATWDNRADLRKMLKVVPLCRLLIETDAPYLAPKPIGRRRNEPAHLRHVAECLADLYGISPEKLAEQTAANAASLFGTTIAD